MATLRYVSGSAQFADFTPVSSALANLPNGAGTIVVLMRRTTITTSGDLAGLVDGPPPGVVRWWHSVTLSGDKITDDDGLVGVSNANPIVGAGTTADDFQILGVDWPSGGAAIERMHCSAKIGSAESWTHEDATANNGGNRANTDGTSSDFVIGALESAGQFTGDIALVAVWAGVRFTDANWLDLWINKKTSDWWNHPAGQPTLLIECTSLTPVDIGANPSTFNALSSSAPTLTGLNPTGWTFDGHGGAARPTMNAFGFLGRGG